MLNVKLPILIALAASCFVFGMSLFVLAEFLMGGLAP
jgi:hypothetical protein